MAPPETQQQTLNPAPPSLSAGGHETRDYYAAQNASRPLPPDEPYLTPYLGLRARLSQTWINRWTILLLLVLVRTLFAIASLDDNLGSARREALSMCTSVENVGSAMASMPHYMSQGVNSLTAKGITRAVNGLMEGLILVISGVEEIVLFVIHLMTSTYLCLITLAVSGSLHVAVSVAEDVGNFLNSTIQDVGKELGDVAGDFQSAMNSFMSDLNKVTSLLTGNSAKPPTIDLSSEISKLDSLQLPTGYDQGLEKLNASIPTFDQVQNFTDNIIRLPFEEVKKLLNASLPKYHMNDTLFPVPAKEQLTFCSDNNGINEFFDSLVNIERIARKVFLAVIIVAAILAMAPMAWRETRRYYFMKERVPLIKSHATDPLDAVYIVSRPYTSATGIWLGDKFSFGSSRVKILIRWSVAYATTIPALFVLSLAIAGLLACLCQYILLKAIEKEVPVLENMVIGFADKVINSLNNASEQWAVGTNKIIIDLNNDINHDVLGWVNTTTTAVNSTLVAFVDETVGVLNDTFGGTILYDPIMGVLNCLVLLKIQGIEKGLTWVHDHAHVDFPLLDNDTFSLGTIQKVSDSQTDLLATGPNSASADAITRAVGRVINFLAKTIRQEAIISTCVLLIWVIIALVGVGQSAWWLWRGGPLDGTHERGFHSDPFTGEKHYQQRQHELKEMSNQPAPSYEQAMGSPDPGNHSANRYNGQSYTLTPLPLPTFDFTKAPSPTVSSGFQPAAMPNQPSEKVYDVPGSRNVDTAIRRPTHIRASSHGDYALTTPVSPQLPPNPFLNPNYETNSSKPNFSRGGGGDPTIQQHQRTSPFADPSR